MSKTHIYFKQRLDLLAPDRILMLICIVPVSIMKSRCFECSEIPYRKVYVLISFLQLISKLYITIFTFSLHSP